MVEKIILLTSTQGTYDNNRIVLKEPPAEVRDVTPLIIMFMSSSDSDLRAPGINQIQAAALCSTLSPFDDGNESERDPYNGQDTATANL